MKRIYGAGMLVLGLAFAAYTFAGLPLLQSGPNQAQETTVSTDALAEVLQLDVHAFELPAPTGEYTLNVWVERWTPEAKAPEVYNIGTMGARSGGTLTVNWPNESHNQVTVFWKTADASGTSAMGARSNIPELQTKPGEVAQTGTSIMQPREMKLGATLPLMAIMQNKKNVQVSSTENVEQNNDVTYYVRARLAPGKMLHPVAWKDGKIQFE